MTHRLLGDWTLVSYITINPDGTEGRPYGDAIGRLSYSVTGHMSGQVMRPNRPPVTGGHDGTRHARTAYAGYIAYFGTYRVNEAEGTVVHHVDGALNPSWVGGHQVRRMQFDGDLLILQADVAKGGGVVRHVLTWRKLGEGEPAS